MMIYLRTDKGSYRPKLIPNFLVRRTILCFILSMLFSNIHSQKKFIVSPRIGIEYVGYEKLRTFGVKDSIGFVPTIGISFEKTLSTSISLSNYIYYVSRNYVFFENDLPWFVKEKFTSAYLINNISINKKVHDNILVGTGLSIQYSLKRSAQGFDPVIPIESLNNHFIYGLVFNFSYQLKLWESTLYTGIPIRDPTRRGLDTSFIIGLNIGYRLY